MNLDEFLASVAANNPPCGASRLLQALWHDAGGDWQRAHEIVQSVKGRAGVRVHAYLHRKEGDPDNAKYWYDRAAAELCQDSLKQEWEALVTPLLREASK